MVSGGTVTGDASTLKGYLDKYQGEVDGLDANWKGSSHDHLQSIATEFVSEYTGITTQMASFASACDLYQEYEQTKTSLSTAESNYNTAVSNKDSSSMTSYGNQVASFKTKLNELKAKIEEALNSAKSPTLTATSSASQIAGLTTGAENTSTDTTTTDTTGVTAPTGKSANAVANKAVDWAISIANDNRYGYVSGGMGNGGYDCTQFVHAAYEAAGISLPKKGYVNNANIVEYYTQNGFKWYPGKIDVNKLQAGDVLVNQAHHAEIYIGNNQKVGAHDNYDSAQGDSQGNEISVDNYKEFSNGGWDGFLRFEGTTT